VCSRKGFRNARALARKQPDPNDPRKGSFTATVEMHPGVQVEILDMTTEGLEAHLLPEMRLPVGDFGGDLRITLSGEDITPTEVRHSSE